MKRRVFLKSGILTFLLMTLLGTSLLMEAPSVGAASSWLTYKSGSHGENVVSIQYLLRAHGLSLATDGQFGPTTTQRVKDFQGKNGLTRDGIVGPNTWEKLIVTTRQGSKGDAVVALQRQLNAHGAKIATDGQFGSGTAQAVKSFQSKNGLGADGVAGPQTWNKLVGGSTGGGGGGSSIKLSQSEAQRLLSNAGISVHSSGNCSDRNNPNCTSLEQIRRTTINGVIAFKRASGCAITITGGTENGHASGTYSHHNGYKVDVAHTSCVTSYIHSHFSYKGHRSGDNAPMYDDAKGNRYADEGSHWDIIYYR